MLRELYIENLAVIEKCRVSFDKGLNVFTGETGAGKSILVGGINAVLGGRVYKDAVRNGAEKAVITALFDNLPESTRDKLSEYGYLTEEDELLLTREISAFGNTARINGRTATAAVLKEIAAGLIDIHGQNDTHSLISAENQLKLTDRFGNIDITEYSRVFREFSAVSRKLKTLQGENRLRDERIAVLTERLNDLSPYKLMKGEFAEVEKKLEKSRNAENLANLLNRAYGRFCGADDLPGAAELLKGAADDLTQTAEIIPELNTLAERVKSAVIEIDDIKEELSKYTGEESDELENLPALEERMSDFLRLQRKYGADIDELTEKAAKWREELDGLTDGGYDEEKLLNEKKRLGEELRTLGGAVTAKRAETAAKLGELIKDELIYLNMPDVRIKFDVTREKVTVTGMDGIEPLISVNKGEELKPAWKIASGGELSRIMLAIKSVLAASDDIPTMVFDEIDAGISGRAARSVGVKLSELSKQRQVLCVTHLAQIAALADRHLLIEKISGSERAFTNVRQIDGDERKRELARIISGDDDEISIKNAERLIGKKL